ncbi:MAG: hypothetical protein LPK25_01975 [Cyclobacteriaceae bacterium]|nr:hypothetical protein [Cyclobacteriaceae bacterium]MDX5465561.1 hypothetical protein [Cyclobacteriaceae bacterium]
MKTQNDQETKHAAFELAGMIYGISLDGIVNRNEFEALKNWCIQNEILCENPSFLDLFEKIRPIIMDGNVNHEELDEINLILKSFLGDFETEQSFHPNLYFLNGIFQGIIASGDVNTYEIYRLKQWLEKNNHLEKESPFDELFPLIRTVLEDKKVDDKESAELKSFFQAHIR